MNSIKSQQTHHIPVPGRKSASMEKPTTNDVALLGNIMEGLAHEDGESIQEAVCALVGVAEDSIENVAENVAQALGLKQSNSLIQTGVYILTMAAIQESVQLIGIGVGLAKLDVTGFEMAQIKQKVQENSRKLDVVISAPLKVALDYFDRATVNMKNDNIAGTIKEMEKVKENAILAYHHAEGQGATVEDLKNSVLAKQLTICAEVLIQSYDGTKITPFILLDKNKKRTISAMIELDVKRVQNFYNSHSISIFALNRSGKAEEKQNILDGLLRTTYPFISEGRGLTSPRAPVQMPYDLELIPDFLPDGEDYAAQITIGRLDGRPQSVCAWREKDLAMVDVMFTREKQDNGQYKMWFSREKSKITDTTRATLHVTGNLHKMMQL